MRLNSLELAGSEVGYETHLLADEVGGVVEFRYAAHYCASAHAVVYAESQEFVGLGHFLAFHHLAHADVEFLECGEVYGFLHGLGSPLLKQVLLLGVLEFLNLCLHHGVVDLLEEELRFADLHTVGHEVETSGHIPFQILEAELGGEFLRHERGEGLEHHGEVGAYLQGDVEDGGCAVRVGLDKLPGLGVGEILVADAGYVHGVFQTFAELEVVEVVGEGPN